MPVVQWENYKLTLYTHTSKAKSTSVKAFLNVDNEEKIRWQTVPNFYDTFAKKFFFRVLVRQ